MKGKKVTIYSTSEFFGSVTKQEATLVETGRKNYAQYDNAPYVIYIGKGKRTPYIKRATYAPYILVIEGWGHPEPQDFLTPAIVQGNEVEVRMSRYSSHDERFKTEFDSIITPYIVGKEVIMDMRATVGTSLMQEVTV